MWHKVMSAARVTGLSDRITLCVYITHFYLEDSEMALNKNLKLECSSRNQLWSGSANILLAWPGQWKKVGGMLWPNSQLPCPHDFLVSVLVCWAGTGLVPQDHQGGRRSVATQLPSARGRRGHRTGGGEPGARSSTDTPGRPVPMVMGPL